MTTSEAIKKIQSEHKFYLGKYPRQTAYSIIDRYRKGTITLNKLKEFMGKYGYVMTNEGHWQQK